MNFLCTVKRATSGSRGLSAGQASEPNAVPKTGQIVYVWEVLSSRSRANGQRCEVKRKKLIGIKTPIAVRRHTRKQELGRGGKSI